MSDASIDRERRLQRVVYAVIHDEGTEPQVVIARDEEPSIGRVRSAAERSGTSRSERDAVPEALPVDIAWGREFVAPDVVRSAARLCHVVSQAFRTLDEMGERLFDIGAEDPPLTRRERLASEAMKRREELGSAMPYRRVASVDAEPADRLDGSVLICGPALEGLDLLADRSVRTVVTSPPYWSLRDYEADGQIGRDDALGDYLKSIAVTFDKVRRVLTDDGTVWLNVGDSYTSGNRRYRAPDRKNRARAMRVRPSTPEGLKPKDLIGVPWRLALALQDAGWWLRSEVIWHKPNAHPESVRDRPTKAHETVFLLSKGQDYYYDTDAVRGPNDRRLRTVWDISTEPRRRADSGVDDHPAVMPLTLARQCVMITSEPGDVVLDPYAGSGTTLLAARELGRCWVGIELNPAFVDLIERRLAL